MPIEIRELQIKAIVQDTPAASSGSSGSASSSSGNDAIIAACVEQVLEILEQKNER